jgi:hypothetical protein
MQTVIWGDLRDKIEREMDLQEESIIDEDMLKDYGNKGIDYCETRIHLLCEDYFKSKYELPMVEGTSEYAMPSDIYANKIRYVQFDDGQYDYKVKKIKTRDIVNVQADDDYRFDVQHSSAADGIKFVLYPAARETTDDQIVMWYIRNANEIEDDDSVVDIPEFVSVVEAYVKHQASIKLRDPLLITKYKDELDRETQAMMATLGTMIPDDEEELDIDTSFYDDMV